LRVNFSFANSKLVLNNSFPASWAYYLITFIDSCKVISCSFKEQIALDNSALVFNKLLLQEAKLLFFSSRAIFSYSIR
jgi:hypothetical protein